jgi:hypothetical protein
VPLEVQILSVIFGVLGTVGALGVILWFKLKKRELETRGSDPELGPVVDALRDDVEQLADMQESTRAQLADMQERLDFAERLLTAGPASQEDRSG